MSTCKCCGMPAQMASKQHACLHVCLLACRAFCLLLPVAGSVGRAHGELSPLGQNGQTQRRAVRHGGGGLSVGVRHRMRAGGAHA